jgi:mannose-1-phosphate guanylyltransferase/mannose-6-phosphate isomerase
MNITPVVLCGGSGNRLWPLSREDYPKQFLKLGDENTLFQQSIKRVVALQSSDINITEIIIVTNERHRFLVQNQLHEIAFNLPIRIILEPLSKNSAPALTLAALAAHENDQNSILVSTPSDQYISNLDIYVDTIHTAIRSTKSGCIVTMGIKPRELSTEFGYCQYEGDDTVKDVLDFIEKPDLVKLQGLVELGKYAWNSGIFILEVNTWLKLIKKTNIDMYTSIRDSWKNKKIDSHFERPCKDNFNQSPNDSIDYAVMEKARALGTNIKLVMLNTDWSDLGTYDALREKGKKDDNGNTFIGDVIAHEASNTFAIASKKNISLLGIDNLIVIETADTVLVANNKNIKSIKELINTLKQRNKNSLLTENLRVERPWGWYEIIESSDFHKVKHIHINAGASISLQYHKHRSEHWIVIKGLASVQKDNHNFDLHENESTYIKKEQVHQLINNTDCPLEIIEIQVGQYLGEDDIVRLEDRYGR